MKIKTRQSAKKRIKKTKNFLFRKKAYKSHLLKHKNSKRLRRLSEPTTVHPSDRYAFVKMLPYL
jgi:large subunit ribosomal protein L35